MATVRLVPSLYFLSNSSYLSVTDSNNMYTNTDSTTYAQIHNNRSSTSSYYLYISGFDFSSIPSNAVVSSFSIKLKGYESGIITNIQYAPVIMGSYKYSLLDVNNKQLMDVNGNKMQVPNGGEMGGNLGQFSNLTTSAQTLTATMNADWETVYEAGSNLSIQINCCRASQNTAAYVYIYGAEIEVEYTIPDSASVYFKINGTWTQVSQIYKKVN